MVDALSLRVRFTGNSTRKVGAILSAITSNSTGELTGEAASESASITGDSTRKLTDKVANTRAPQESARLPPDRTAGLIQKAKNLHAKGVSWAAIARRWNAEGTPTLSGTGQWHGANVARLVNSNYFAC